MLFLVDLGLIALISIAACLSHSHLWIMTSVVGISYAFRMFLAWRRKEALFLLLATFVGGFNEFNTVDLHGVYRYRVEVFSPASGSIPLWMLLFWGLILRFAASLSWHWIRKVDHPGKPHWPRLTFLAALVLFTRLAIFQLYLDPIWSWLPFGLATVTYFVVLRPKPAYYSLFLLIAVAGTATESVFIQVAGMHEYHLGVFGGVPLWITIWWSLGVLIWQEFGAILLPRLTALENKGYRSKIVGQSSA